MRLDRLIPIALAACLLLTTGCTAWRPSTFDWSRLDWNRLRDPRAVDIDNRLSTAPPTIRTVDSF